MGWRESLGCPFAVLGACLGGGCATSVPGSGGPSGSADAAATVDATSSSSGGPEGGSSADEAAGGSSGGGSGSGSGLSGCLGGPPGASAAALVTLASGQSVPLGIALDSTASTGPTKSVARS